MDDKTYRVSTLGCRVNKADSLAIERELTAKGFRRATADEVPALWVVNTCAVTGEGLRKSRKLVRRCAQSGASVVVTGCGAEMDESAFHVSGVNAIVPNEKKPAILSYECSQDACHEGATKANEWLPEELVRVPVKVQDGCRRYCTYCVVPYLRPKPSSRTITSVLEEIRMLRELEVGEVILCGIDLGSYRDPATGRGIDSLVAAVMEQAGKMWVRLSSIELSDVNDRLVDLLCAGGALCRHLHVPMQSGDARVLADMGRKYTPEGFAEKIERTREVVGEIAVTTDAMVGFPTEDENAFLATKSLLGSIGFSRVHVFKYSPRPHTQAYALGDLVDGGTKSGRAADLRALAAANALRFHEGFVGRIIPVLVEDVMDIDTLTPDISPQGRGEESGPGYLFGRTESFAGMVMEGEPDLIGDVVEVHVTSAGPEGLRGRITGGHAIEPRRR